MKVVITGGGGFLGSQLCQKLLEKKSLVGSSGEQTEIDEIVLFDARFPDFLKESTPGSVTLCEGDIADEGLVRDLIDQDDISVFHLASMVSGECEIHFDEALRVNLDGGRHLLEALRAREGKPRIVFASSVAAFGGEAMVDPVGDTTKRTPQTTYGVTKVIGELLINDYSRKGFLDGRSVRLPTVIIRPGKPNTAASSWASGMFREPLNGEICYLPVHRDQFHPVIGYRDVIDSFIALHEADESLLGDDRAFGLPSHRVSVKEALAALEQVAGEEGITLGTVVDEPNERVRAIVNSWPTATDGSRAVRVGCPEPSPLSQVIRDYITDFLTQPTTP